MEYYISFLKCFSLFYLLLLNPVSKSIINDKDLRNDFTIPIISFCNYFLEKAKCYSIFLIKYSSLFFVLILLIMLNYQGLAKLFIYNHIETNDSNSLVFHSYLIEFFIDFVYPFLGLFLFFKIIRNNTLLLSLFAIILLIPFNEILYLKAYKLRYYYLENIEADIPEELKINYWDYFNNLIDNFKYFLFFIFILVVTIEFIKKKFNKNA